MLVHSFSAMVSPIPTPIPVSLGILLWRTWGCGAARPPRPAFLQGTPFPFALPSLLVSLPLFHPSAECGTPHPPSTSPGAQPYLAATSQGVFLATFVFISSPLHVFPRCSQHLMLNPATGKMLPGVPLLPLGVRGCTSEGSHCLQSTLFACFASELQ